MKAKKLAAVLLSALIMGGTLNSVGKFGGNTVMGAEYIISDQLYTKDGIIYKRDGDHVVISDAKGAKDSVEIPETIKLKESMLSTKLKEYPVTVIAANAFAGTGVTEVVLSKNIQRICNGAFRDCAALKSICIKNKDCVIESRGDTGDTICNEQSNGSHGSLFTGEIIGYEGSTAVNFAAENGYKFKPISSPEDGKVTSSVQTKPRVTTTTTKAVINPKTTAKPVTSARTAPVTTATQTNPIRFITETTTSETTTSTNPISFITEATTTEATTSTNPISFITEATTTETTTSTNPISFITEATTSVTTTSTNPIRFFTETTDASTTTQTTTVIKITTATTTSKTTTTTSATTTTSRTTTSASSTTSYIKKQNAVDSGADSTTTTVTYPPATLGKPVFHLSDTVVCLDDAQTKNQHVTISVDGANGLYCNTLIYVYFDSRMKVGEAYGGSAIQKLATGQAVGDTGDFIVLVTAGRVNDGKDGVMWEIDFTLPSNCQVGDVFTFEIGPTKYGMEPLFSDVECSDAGLAMTDYIFSEGLDVGSITVIDNDPYALGDVNNDTMIDSVDASMVLAEYAAVSSGNGSRFRNNQQPIAADVNGNGIIDAVDASSILAYYAYVSGNGEYVPFEDFVKRKK